MWHYSLRILQLVCSAKEFDGMSVAKRVAHIYFFLHDGRDCHSCPPVTKPYLLAQAAGYGAVAYTGNAALTWLGAPNSFRLGALLLTGLSALDLVFRCGNLALGTKTPSIMQEPWVSTSHQEFWGKRWNKMMQNLLFRCVFQTVDAMGLPRALSVLLTFFASGLVHVVPLALHPQATVPSLVSVLLFFVAQGGFVLAERATQIHTRYCDAVH